MRFTNQAKSGRKAMPARMRGLKHRIPAPPLPPPARSPAHAGALPRQGDSGARSRRRSGGGKRG